MVACVRIGLHRWNDFVGPGRPERMSVFLCLTLKLLLALDPVQDHNRTLVSCQNIYCNGGPRSAFMSVPCQGKLVRLYSCVLLLTCYRDSIRCDSITSPHSLSQYTTMAIAGVRLCCLNRWHDIVGPGRKGGTRKFLCAWLWSCHTGSM